MDTTIDFQQVDFESTEVFKFVFDLNPLEKLTASKLNQLVLKDIQYLVYLTHMNFLKAEVALPNPKNPIARVNKDINSTFMGDMVEINEKSLIKVQTNGDYEWVKITDYLNMASEEFIRNVKSYLVFVENFKEENPALLTNFSQNKHILDICEEISKKLAKIHHFSH